MGAVRDRISPSWLPLPLPILRLATGTFWTCWRGQSQVDGRCYASMSFSPDWERLRRGQSLTSCPWLSRWRSESLGSTPSGYTQTSSPALQAGSEKSGKPGRPCGSTRPYAMSSGTSTYTQGCSTGTPGLSGEPSSAQGYQATSLKSLLRWKVRLEIDLTGL